MFLFQSAVSDRGDDISWLMIVSVVFSLYGIAGRVAADDNPQFVKKGTKNEDGDAYEHDWHSVKSSSCKFKCIPCLNPWWFARVILPRVFVSADLGEPRRCAADDHFDARNSDLYRHCARLQNVCVFSLSVFSGSHSILMHTQCRPALPRNVHFVDDANGNRELCL